MTSSLCCIAPLVLDLGLRGGELLSQHLPAFGFFCPTGLCTFKQRPCILVAVPSKESSSQTPKSKPFFRQIPICCGLDAPATVWRARRPSKSPFNSNKKATPPPGSGRISKATLHPAAAYLRKRSINRLFPITAPCPLCTAPCPLLHWSFTSQCLPPPSTRTLLVSAASA
jgi:hypothetical protein